MNSSRAPALTKEERATVPPPLATSAMLLVALWRFQRELQALNWEALVLSADEAAIAESTWYVINEELKGGLARMRRAMNA